jgi:type I restriction enzyme S subunit
LSNHILLKDIADYSDTRIKLEKNNIQNYVTTDSMLPNKNGILQSDIIPHGNLTSYQEGDILIGNIRPYLKKIWYSDRSGGCSPDVLVLRTKPFFNSKFLYYSLIRDDFFAHMMKGSKGTKMPRGDKNQILRFEVPDFHPNIQTILSTFLSAIDTKININLQIKLHIDNLTKMIFNYWFVQFDFPDENGKPYKSSGGEMEWNNEVKREIPRGWTVVSLLEIANFENGIPCQKYRPKSEEHLRVIKIKEMNEGFSNATEKVSLNIPKKSIIENGDVLFSWSASLEVKIWTGGIGALNQHIFKVSSKKYPRSFYFFHLLNYLNHFKMMASNRKTTMGHITQDHLSESRIVLPPINKILELNSILEPLMKKQELCDVEKLSLTELRDWLIPLFMNGQIKLN